MWSTPEINGIIAVSLWAASTRTILQLGTWLLGVAGVIILPLSCTLHSTCIIATLALFMNINTQNWFVLLMIIFNKRLCMNETLWLLSNRFYPSHTYLATLILFTLYHHWCTICFIVADGFMFSFIFCLLHRSVRRIKESLHTTSVLLTDSG